MQTITDPDIQSNISEAQTGEDLLRLLKTVECRIEQIWHQERMSNATAGTDTRRQMILREAHKAVGEWFEYESLRRQGAL